MSDYFYSLGMILDSRLQKMSLNVMYSAMDLIRLEATAICLADEENQ